jgi:hypothetical protein
VEQEVRGEKQIAYYQVGKYTYIFSNIQIKKDLSPEIH